MKLQCSRKKTGRPQRRFMDGVREDLQRAGVTEENDGDRVR